MNRRRDALEEFKVRWFQGVVAAFMAVVLVACNGGDRDGDTQYPNLSTSSADGQLRISVFGKIGGIPSSYMLLARSKNGIEFFRRDERAAESVEGGGSVLIYTNVDSVSFVNRRAASAERIFKSRIESDFSREKGLCIRIDRYIDRSGVSASVYIYDLDEVVMIQDDDESVWKGFLSSLSDISLTIEDRRTLDSHGQSALLGCEA